MLKGLIAAVGMSLAVAVPQAAQAAFEKKVALIVGNAAYQNAPALANPVTDAKAIAAAFERLGFETVTGFDLDKDALEDTIREFARASRKADLTAFFYAGHGIAFDDKNYIIPVDARFNDATALDFEAVGMDFAVKQMRYNDGVSPVQNILKPDRGRSAEPGRSGDLAQILAFCGGIAHKSQLPGSCGLGSQVSVVAGARNQFYLLFAAPGLTAYQSNSSPQSYA